MQNKFVTKMDIPWLIKPDAYHALQANIQDVKALSLEDLKVEKPQLQVQDGVAIINVNGVISKNIDVIDMLMGYIDLNNIAQLIDEAEGREDVKSVLFSFSSPGGIATGVEEVSQKIERMTKPTIAWTDDMSCSASYYLMAGCDAIYCTETSTIGSVGVYVPVMDFTRMYENAGIKVDVITNREGKYKAAGYEGTSLTQEQRDEMQRHVQVVYDMFKSHVIQHRRIKEENLMGQVYLGVEAVNNGYADELATFEQALEDAKKLV